MANKQAWTDLKVIEKSSSGIKSQLANFKYSFGIYEGLKNEIQSDNSRRQQLVALLAEHPSLTLQGILDEYSKFKQLYDWLMANGF